MFHFPVTVAVRNPCWLGANFFNLGNQFVVSGHAECDFACTLSAMRAQSGHAAV
jgi:hypothetical protein